MTARHTTHRRIAAAVAALVAAAGLAVYPLGSTQPANAATDPISGFGTTDSTVTVTWADGITGKDNKTIVTPRQKRGTSAFVDDLWASYQNLKVTVSQTQGLAHQGVQVTWTGGAPSAQYFTGNYLQIMQCYGDAESGPDPEACQWGGYSLASLPASQSSSVSQDNRNGDKCLPDWPSQECDPVEPSQADHQDPAAAGQYNVPFIPASDPNQRIYRRDSADPAKPALGNYFQAQSTNEVPTTLTSQDGTGQVSFELQTGREASGLGCGDPDEATGGAPRGCWLVVVPRGMLAPNGTRQGNNGVTVSALSASNWAQRLQVHLGFLSTGIVCPQDTALRPIAGTELAANLMTSWQPALCQHGGAVYSFTSTPDTTSTAQLVSTLPGAARIVLTTQPITFADQGPPLVYAPVAVTGLGFAFNIDTGTQPDIQQVRQLNVTPLQLAKSLTQSYKGDLPGGVFANSPPPDWMKTAYTYVSYDPQWQAFNPGANLRDGVTGAPMTTADQSAVNQMVWSWIQSDSGTRAWLRGQPDAGGMVVNPNYQKLNLGDSPPATTYSRADPTCYRPADISKDAPADACVTSVDYVPYAASLDDAAVHVQRAFTSGRTATWDTNETAPYGTAGYWGKSQPTVLGRRFSWGITATSDSARYGLPIASLCLTGFPASGCVAPTAASLGVAVSAAKADSTGLLHVDPANPGTGGYPLTEIVYAAVSTNQDAAGLRDSAALLEYAAGAGQTSGVEVGQLPPGYLALPDSLRTQTRSAAATLRELANAKPSASPSPTAGQSTTSVPNGGPSPSVVSTSMPPGGTVSPPPVGLAARSTPSDSLGVIRWVLVAALVASAAGGFGGVLLRHPPTALTRLVRRTRL